MLDRVTRRRQLLRERGTVEGAHLPRRTEHRPGGDCDIPAVLPDRAGDHDVRVQLRVRSSRTLHAPRGRVQEASRDNVACGLLDHPRAVPPAHQPDVVAHVLHRALHGSFVRRLELLPLPAVRERPHDRDGLRGAERDVDPSPTRAVRTGAAQPSSCPRVASLHDSDKGRTL